MQKIHKCIRVQKYKHTRILINYACGIGTIQCGGG